MAEEFVRKEHFDEYALRMDELFLGIEKRMEQGFAYAEKTREQNFVHLNQRLDDMTQGINQRFDGLERRMDQLHADMLQMRNWLVWLFGLVVFGFIGSIVLLLFRELLAK